MKKAYSQQTSANFYPSDYKLAITNVGNRGLGGGGKVATTTAEEGRKEGVGESGGGEEREEEGAGSANFAPVECGREGVREGGR